MAKWHEMSEHERRQEQVNRAMLDVHRYALHGLPGGGVLHIHPLTWLTFETAQPVLMENLSPQPQKLFGVDVELDETMPENEVEYRLTRSVVLDLEGV